MKDKEYNITKQYFTLIMVTAISVVLYLILKDAKLEYFITLDESKTIDKFISRMMEQNDISPASNIFSFCEYNLQNMVILLLSKVAGNSTVGINLYYIMSFFFISIAMFWFLKKQKISCWIALYGAVLVAFLPYHVDRGEGQIVTSTFFLFPIFAGIWQEIIYEEKVEKFNITYMAIMCIAPFIDLNLSVMLIILTTILIMQRRKWHVMKRACIYLMLLLFSTLAVFFLTVDISDLNLQDSIQLAKEEGLRIFDLFAPIRYHIIDRLWDIRCDYDVTLHAHGESGFNSLGILLTVCMIVGLFYLFFYEDKDKRIVWMSWINVLVILIANVGGINLLFEYFGLHIGYWNRMGIVIIVFTVAIGTVLADTVYQRLKKIVDVKLAFGLLALIGMLGFMEILLRQNMLG